MTWRCPTAPPAPSSGTWWAGDLFVNDVGSDNGCNQDCADPRYFWKLSPDPH